MASSRCGRTPIAIDNDDLYLGIDIGTSGVRCSVIDAQGKEQASNRVALADPVRDGNSSQQDAQLWLRAVEACVRGTQRLKQVKAIAVDATSSSVLLCNAEGHAMTAAMMYNDTSSVEQAERIASVAPQNSGAHGPSSSLAKLLAMRDNWPQLAADKICHQADFINTYLSGNTGISDENNCLKLGYDIVERRWPDWFGELGVDRKLLPEVVKPGTVISTVSTESAEHLGLSDDCKLVSGTTDSIAAFIATGVSEIGDAVTSLGSSLVIKQLAGSPVFDSDSGVYSHRYYANDSLWLVGGASNAGCRVLSELFDSDTIDSLSEGIDPHHDSGLDYIPLPAGSRGERFPQTDATLQARITPRPSNDVRYFQGLLESITRVEKRGYQKLQELGCEPPQRVLSTGGGSRNRNWTKLRERLLGVPVSTAAHTEASYGAALLARYAMTN